MRERLAQGGEIAQATLRELFPGGFKLSPDPNGGRYLWATGQTALAADWLSKRDADGYLPGEHWPRVYSATTEAEAPTEGAHRGESLVAGACFAHTLTAQYAIA